jgi:heme/copper-type cytochrome/quinol oxidase subunit 3
VEPETHSQPLDDRLAPDVGLFGLKIFLASLTVLFAASLVAYVLIRTTAQGRGLAFGTLHLPTTLWFSTVIIIASSFTIHRALQSVRSGRQPAFRRAMVLTAVLGLAFLAIQVPSLYLLLQRHEAQRANNVFLYGLILMLIALHAFHVIGGLIPLGVVTSRALQGRYHAGRYEGVQYCSLYWHFLDVVWLAMFAVLFVTG